jgi:transposase
LEQDVPFVIRIKENLNFIQPLLKQLKGVSKTLRSGYLFLVPFKVDNPLKLYRKRWELEGFFKKIKTAGFNLEDTHLKGSNRLKSLILLCAMAYLICTLMVIFRHHKVQAMKFKTTLNCYQFSFFRYGLDWITELILYAHKKLSRFFTMALNYFCVG